MKVKISLGLWVFNKRKENNQDLRLVEREISKLFSKNVDVIFHAEEMLRFKNL
jgi:hypothetical protein